ncbi:MAG TPA: undecaprenyl-diphosphate phosphatase [Solirubrobacteraceae bacterium]|nr:undecaprenyl-diphosphate phosphatase [Solirubrobacteraceae bacterium]
MPRTDGNGALAATALGLLQGPTELLPVSSSAHTTLVPWLIGRDAPDYPPGRRKAFEVALHVGAGGALAIDMYGELRERAADATAAQWIALVLAVIPAMAAGALLKGPIERRLGGPGSIAAGLIGGALVMVAADAGPDRPARHFAELGPADGLAIGLAQACALMPGVSRNGATLAAARARGFSRDAAQAISWTVGLPVMLGAGVLKAADLQADSETLLGGAAAFVSTLVFARILRRHGRRLLPWALYRCALAALVLRRLGSGR